MWELSVSSSQFCCELKTALKKNQVPLKTHTSDLGTSLVFMRPFHLFIHGPMLAESLCARRYGDTMGGKTTSIPCFDVAHA